MILLDIDDVMADFYGQFCSSYEVQLTGDIEVDSPKITEHLYINPPSKHFWIYMYKLPWADDLLELCLEFDNVTFCTAISEPVDLFGRSIWLKNHYPTIPVIYTKSKHFVQGVLIDDRRHHTDVHPHPTILFPSIFNPKHLRDPLSYVRSELIKIYGQEGTCS